MRNARAVFLSFCFIISSHILWSQATINPDISVIPRFRFDADNSANPSNALKFGTPQFTLEEFEIAIQGYLNPYARADVFMSKPGSGDEPIALEEAYATFLRGLPLDLNVRVGKYLAEFGKLNMLHPHAWPFLTKPLVLQRFLGDEGVNDLGISVSYVFPTETFYSRLTVDMLKGKTLQGIDPRTSNVAGGIGLIDTTMANPTAAFSSRLMGFFTVGDDGDLEVGLSGLTGVHDPYNNYRFVYGAADFKYKWKPSAYTSLTLQGEFLVNDRKISKGIAPGGGMLADNISTGGFYVYGDYQFYKVYSIGTRFDWAQSPYSGDSKSTGAAIFFGFYPVEETTAFRLQFQQVNNATGGTSTTINSVALQIMFSLGPHKAHPF